MNVLLLEDDPVLTKEISEFLRGKNVETTIAYDGVDGFHRTFASCD